MSEETNTGFKEPQIIAITSGGGRGGTWKTTTSSSIAEFYGRGEGLDTLYAEADFGTPCAHERYEKWFEDSHKQHNLLRWFERCRIYDIAGASLKRKLKKQLKNASEALLEQTISEMLEEKQVKKSNIGDFVIPTINPFVFGLCGINGQIDNLVPGPKEKEIENLYLQLSGLKKSAQNPKGYNRIIIDTAAGDDFFIRKALDYADKNVFLIRIDSGIEGPVDKIYSMINEKFKRVMNNEAVYDIITKENISVQNKTFIQLFSDIVWKAKDINGHIANYEKKESENRKNEILDIEKDVYRNYGRHKSELLNLERIAPRMEKLKKVYTPVVAVQPLYIDKAKDIYDVFREELNRLGIEALSPGFKKVTDGGALYYEPKVTQSDLKQLPFLDVYRPHSMTSPVLSTQLENLARFIEK